MTGLGLRLMSMMGGCDAEMLDQIDTPAYTAIELNQVASEYADWVVSGHFQDGSLLNLGQLKAIDGAMSDGLLDVNDQFSVSRKDAECGLPNGLTVNGCVPFSYLQKQSLQNLGKSVSEAVVDEVIVTSDLEYTDKARDFMLRGNANVFAAIEQYPDSKIKTLDKNKMRRLLVAVILLSIELRGSEGIESAFNRTVVRLQKQNPAAYNEAYQTITGNRGSYPLRHLYCFGDTNRVDLPGCFISAANALPLPSQ